MSSVYMPGDREVTRRSATPDDRRLLADLDRRALRLGLPMRDRSAVEWHTEVSWPYGPNVNVGQRIALLNWMETEHLRPTLARGKFHDPCLDWLRTGRCPGVVRCDNRHPASWQDHTTGWVRQIDGARLFVSQPYGLTDAERSKLAALDAEPGLRVQIEETGWYGAGGLGTRFVGVWANEDESALRRFEEAMDFDAELCAGVAAMFREEAER